jgi:hypothetical protein
MPATASPKTTQEVRQFLAEMSSDNWIKLIQQSVDFSYLVGQPFVAVLNGTDDTITNVMCDDKWALVGANAYIHGAPASVASHHAIIIPTKGFDGYCKKSIVGLTGSGERYVGILTIPGDFTHSAAIIFRASSAQ